MLLPILTIATNCLFSQKVLKQTIRGTVTEKATKMPLPGANVVLLDSDPVIGATTDPEGKYRLENAPVGRVGLRISYIGFHDVVIPSLNLTSARELIIDVEMEEKPVLSEEVVITATRSKLRPQNEMATVSARSFTVEETQRYAGSRNDVARMASNFAGVRGTDDSRNDIIIRGNSPAGLLWRLEGVDIPNPNHYGALESTGGPVSILNNNLLANSDFYTGAFPAEYGNAISGVFDLEMRNGNDERHEFLGQIGFNGFELGAEGPVHEASGASYLVNYRYSTLEFFDLLGMEFGTGTAIPKYQDLSFKVNVPKTAAGSFSLFGVAGTSDISFLDSEKDTTSEKLDFYGGEGFDLINGSDMAALGLSNTYLINSTTWTKVTLAGTYHKFTTEIDSIVPAQNDILPFVRNNHTENKLFGSFVLNKKFSSRHNFKVGFTASSTYYTLIDSIYNDDSLRFNIITDYDGSGMMLQPYLEWQFKVSNTLTLNSGLHYQHFLLNNSRSLEPRLGLRWQFRPRQTFSLAYGYHSQLAPITVYFNQTRLPDGSYYRPNEGLDFTRSQHFVAGYDWSLSNYIRLKAELYYQYISNAGVDGNRENAYSVLNQGASFYVWTPDTLVNEGEGQNYGVELTFERFLNEGIYYLFTASVYESKYAGSDGMARNTAFNGNYVFNGLLGREWAMKSKPGKKKVRHYAFLADIKATWAGGQRYTPARIEYDPSMGEYVAHFDADVAYSEKFRDYFRTDLRVAFRQNSKNLSMEWAIDFQNIFNIKNIYSQRFNSQTGEMEEIYQLGLLIVPQFRIEF